LIRIPSRRHYPQTTNRTGKQKNVVFIDHHRMIQEGWISTTGTSDAHGTQTGVSPSTITTDRNTGDDCRRLDRIDNSTDNEFATRNPITSKSKIPKKYIKRDTCATHVFNENSKMNPVLLQMDSGESSGAATSTNQRQNTQHATAATTTSNTAIVLLWINVCKFVFSHPRITISAFSLLFLYLNL
jgi:hypothetical protein